MPTVFLSPSTQEYNNYITGGGSEEYYMNLIADAMIPYLEASGINYSRNNPALTVANSIAQSNAGTYDLHLAIHSNASPESSPGAFRGPNVYYYSTSQEGRRAADIFANNLKAIYPNPDLVITLPTTTLTELRRTVAPAILVEVAYHDNWGDANWIVNNIGPIAGNLALSLTEFLGIPFVSP
jgi:N-acetylmuramoyl-L-alanine amidase